MMTVAHRPDAGHAAPRRVTRLDAMKFYATGRTAEGLRAQAADPVHVELIALKSGESEAAVRGLMLAIADAIDRVAAEGLTQEQCWDEAGLDLVLGPRESWDGAR